MTLISGWKKCYLGLYKELEQIFTTKISRGFDANEFGALASFESALSHDAIQKYAKKFESRYINMLKSMEAKLNTEFKKKK